MEKQFPGIKICFGCRDDKTHLFDDSEHVMKITELKIKRYEFGHINEIKFDGLNHPIEQFIKNSGITECRILTPNPINTKKCVIVTKGQYPTKDLDQRETNILKKIGTEDGYDVEVDTDIKSSGLVMGVESRFLFEAAANGIKTKLIPRGLGTNLYKKMFPEGEILEL